MDWTIKTKQKKIWLQLSKQNKNMDWSIKTKQKKTWLQLSKPNKKTWLQLSKKKKTWLQLSKQNKNMDWSIKTKQKNMAPTIKTKQKHGSSYQNKTKIWLQGSVLRTSLITSEIKWQIQDDIITLIRIWLIRFFERTCCWWLVWLDWVIWWFKRGYASILETTISNVAIGWWQDSNVMTSYH